MDPDINPQRASMKNREALRASGRCGCFYCLAEFTYEAIQDWVDDELTATCPHCQIDSVLAVPRELSADAVQTLLRGFRDSSFS